MKSFAKKRYGQNFLIDPNILRKIVKTINPSPDDLIVEIGSGKGALTGLLLDSGATVHAIEIDNDLIPELTAEFSDYPNFILHHTDALEFDYHSIILHNQKIRVVGNIPYNISSSLLFNIFNNIADIRDIHFLVQREIARRICARANTKDYGILSVISQFYVKPIIDFDVSPKVFRPIPDVYSSLISMNTEPRIGDKSFQSNFHIAVRTAFGKRRKILRNALVDLIVNKNSDSPIDLSRRAESLNIEEFIELTRWIFDRD